MVTFKIEIDENKLRFKVEGTGTNEAFLKAAGLILAQCMRRYAKDSNLTKIPIEFLDYSLSETKRITKDICEKKGVPIVNMDHEEFTECLCACMKSIKDDIKNLTNGI